MQPVIRTYSACIDIVDEGGGTTTPLITNTQKSAQNGLKSNKKCRPQPIRPKGTKEYIVSTACVYYRSRIYLVPEGLWPKIQFVVFSHEAPLNVLTDLHMWLFTQSLRTTVICVELYSARNKDNFWVAVCPAL